jgi:SAM-dependent methyltransferase
MIGKRHEYMAMALCESRMWWYSCLHKLTLQEIRKNFIGNNPRILDAGCGTGGLLSRLIENGFTQVYGFDLSPDAIEYAKRHNGINVLQLDITNFSAGFPGDLFDIVISHDILCLLNNADSSRALSQMLSVLKPGGVLLMNLPAFRAFNGTHDIAVAIKQRYSKKAVQKLVGVQAEIKKIIYWPFLLSPAIFIIRAMQRLQPGIVKKQTVTSDVKMPPLWLNKILYAITNFENNYFQKKPWGSSIFIVLRKPL